jgi:hypothetical protein
MRKKVWCLALVLVALVLGTSVAWADGDFYVITGGGPPVGTKITSLPADGLTIRNPGFYFLGGNLTYSGTGNAITIAADDVTLDLMGFCLSGPGANSAVTGVYMSGHTNIEVRNGTVSAFHLGICEDDNGSTYRVINVRATNDFDGIWLMGYNHLVKNCSASNNTDIGVYVDHGTIADNVAGNNGAGGIWMGQSGSVLGNTVCNNSGNNFAFGSGVAASILVDRNTAFGRDPNYNIYSGTTGVVITANNSGTP